jgi:hypothetical protein
MTRKILEDIKFYDKIKPYQLIKQGVFNSGCGIEDEHLVTIYLDIVYDNIRFKDELEWDITNEDNR